ncbi:PREDICTED: sarcoplasmic reticulum histidine-rich calcium-binding protein-like [Eufriesea mexicana]|uniref:sarcoplasmic reticulum histidine-rich calcium-binding protein-like n=1 Tax=Eufriesea mexicana TaxID=516756 RepID=UPI00083C390D|nr:PREDICTED: sarcoplasmic reticulum histidine-rich calcium-binding protein-like [Eufriesea mexicana]
MDSKTLYLTLVAVTIFAKASSEFTFDSTRDSDKSKVMRTVWRDNDDSPDYKFNKGYSSAYNDEDDRVRKGLAHGDCEHGKRADDKFEKSRDKLEKENGGDDRNMQRASASERDDRSNRTESDDDHDDKHRYDYHQSHNYSHCHRLRDKDHNGNKKNGKHGGFLCIRIVHNRKEVNNKRDRCDYGDCKYGGKHYDDEFKYGYGDNERKHDKHHDDEGSYDAYRNRKEYNRESFLDHDRNEGVDDHGPYYHYEYILSDDNFHKDYPSSTDYHHYRHQNRLESCSSHLTAFNTTMRDTRFKVGIALTITLALGHPSRAGLISLDGEAVGEHQDPLQHGSLASSYLQFHGPVEGPVYEVKVPYAVTHEDNSNDLHGQEQQEQGYALDYVAHPKYEFSYGVEDHRTGDFHGQKETRDGSSVSGQYSVKEPGGGVRVVSYHADKDGFHAVVHTSGKNDHSADVYAGRGQLQVHDHQAEAQQEQDAHDYVASYSDNEGY